jgi:hypothetical protein
MTNSHTPADSLLTGKFGTVVFYLCLVAVILAPLLAGAAYLNERTDQRDVKQEQVRQRSEQEKLCEAISGAVDFWVLVRKSTVELLRDKTLTPTERSSNEAYVAALTKVIRGGGQLSCRKAHS